MEQSSVVAACFLPPDLTSNTNVLLPSVPLFCSRMFTITLFSHFRYKIPLPSPEDLAAAFSATRGLASNSTAGAQKAVDEGGLPMVDVGNDRNVSEVLAEVLLRHGWISLVHDTLAKTSRSERKSSGEGRSREDEWRIFGSRGSG